MACLPKVGSDNAAISHRVGDSGVYVPPQASCLLLSPSVGLWGHLQPFSPLLALLLFGGQSFETQCYVFRWK